MFTYVRTHMHACMHEDNINDTASNSFLGPGTRKQPTHNERENQASPNARTLLQGA